MPLYNEVRLSTVLLFNSFILFHQSLSQKIHSTKQVHYHHIHLQKRKPKPSIRTRRVQMHHIMHLHGAFKLIIDVQSGAKPCLSVF